MRGVNYAAKCSHVRSSLTVMTQLQPNFVVPAKCQLPAGARRSPVGRRLRARLRPSEVWSCRKFSCHLPKRNKVIALDIFHGHPQKTNGQVLEAGATGKSQRKFRFYGGEVLSLFQLNRLSKERLCVNDFTGVVATAIGVQQSTHVPSRSLGKGVTDLSPPGQGLTYCL